VSVETVVSFGKFVELLRNSVIEVLSQKSGLQLRRTRRRHVMYYRVRAPIRLLEQHAVAIAYRLQLRGEVDPGPEFWNEEEVAEDGVEVRTATTTTTTTTTVTGVASPLLPWPALAA
jgi:hypothetical protein